MNEKVTIAEKLIRKETNSRRKDINIRLAELMSDGAVAFVRQATPLSLPVLTMSTGRIR